MMDRKKFVFICACIAVFCVSSLQADQYKVQAKDSVLAVITHKAGLASGLAHNHFIRAKKYSAGIVYDAKSKRLKMSVTIQVKNLEVDSAKMHKKWFATIKKLGILQEAFSAISTSDRQKIRNAMLDSGQLDAKKYPKINGKILSIEDGKSKVGQKEFHKKMMISLKVHGKTVKKKVAVEIKEEKGTLLVEIVGKFKFTEFGIAPYSAFLGAVQNQDEFHLFARIYAVKKK